MRTALLPVALFVALLVLTNPLGDFPLNDDWSYGQAVRGLVQEGRLRLADWTSMPLLTQALWGALFALPFGFSFTALRFSTLVLALVCLAVLAIALRRTGTPLAVAGPLLLMANPVFLGLSHTFMTDVPFLALLTASIILLARGRDESNRPVLLAGMALAVAASLIRQTGMLIPLAFGLVTLVEPRPRLTRSLAAVCFFAVTAGVLLAYQRWLATTGGLPTAYGLQLAQTLTTLRSGPAGAALHALRSLLTMFIYLSIFTLPIGILFISRASRQRLLLFLVISAAMLALTRLADVGFVGNILSDRGIGPFTLAHTAAFAAFTGLTVSKVVLALLALVGGTLLLEMVWQGMRQPNNSLKTICLWLALLYFASLSMVQPLDRYVLVYLPLVILVALPALARVPLSRPALVAGGVLLAGYLAFSVAATHDYLAWNRVRWQALHHLTGELSVPAERIDGGFEFNGLYTYDEDYVRVPGRSPWWVKDDDYVVAFDVLPGYAVIHEYPVRTWLPAAIRRIYLLGRPGNTEAP